MSTAESGPTREGGVGTRNVRTAGYHRLLESLPNSVRRNAEAAFQMFLANPDHAALRRHPLERTPTGDAIALRAGLSR